MSESNNRKYQICTRCVMDTSDEGIVFDENGVCNHCHRYDQVVKPYILIPEEKYKKLNVLIDEIKAAGKKRKYDCIIGISGGLDSSYVAYLAWKHGLRAILVHFDNGWDSELAVKNIENIVGKTGFDYFNYIVDWEEFRDLQLSYFKASVVDVEVPTDHGICCLIPQLALKFKVKYNLFGINLQTEFTMGKNWNYGKKMNRYNLERIHSEFGTKPLKTFPYITPFQEILYRLSNVKLVNLLEFSDCDYKVIKNVLKNELSWQDYGVKHGESVFTKFYQSYYLPRKFGFDKRRAHLSDQINSQHIDRETAIQELSRPIYMSESELKNEIRYVASKLGVTPEAFQQFIDNKNMSHEQYGTDGFYGSNLDKTVLFLKQSFRKLKRYFMKA